MQLELDKMENKLKSQEVGFQEMKRELLHEKHKKETSTMGQLKMENKGLKTVSITLPTFVCLKTLRLLNY